MVPGSISAVLGIQVEYVASLADCVRMPAICRGALLKLSFAGTSSSVAIPLCRGCEADYRICIGSRARLPRWKDSPAVYPGLGPLIHLLGIRFEYESLTWPEASHIDQCTVPLGQFSGVVPSIRLVHEVNVRLGASECCEVAAGISDFDIWRNHGRNHEGGIHDLAEPKLLQEVVLRTEHGSSLCTAIQHLVYPVRGRSAEPEFDPVKWEKGFKRLDRRVMAPGLVSSVHCHVCKIFRLAHSRSAGNKNAARSDGVTLTP